ncbi:MAG TPA: hypothetical protein VF614_13955 [Chthoniobacteraceae bacterium]
MRDPRAPKPPGAPAAEAPDNPINLLTTVETWALSQSDFAALLNTPSDDAAFYNGIETLAKTGKAKLLGLMAVSTKSGQRAVTESIDEVRYGTEFDPAQRPGEIPFPVAWETRNVGDTLELEPILREDGDTIDINLVPQTVRFGGFEDIRAEAVAEPIAQPKFHTEKVTTSVTRKSGVATFLSTATPAGDLEPAEAMVHVQILRSSAQNAPPPRTRFTDSFNTRVEFLLYTLDREAARRILMENTDSVASLAAVAALADKGEAQLELIRAFVTKSGQRAVTEEIVEKRFGTNSGNPPGFATENTPADRRSPASFTSFEVRNVGVTVECEPLLSPDGLYANINVVPQIVSVVDVLEVNGVATRYPAQPVFTTRKISTSASTGVGVPVLLGTMNHPRENGVNGRRDNGKTSLAYIRMTPATP